MTPADARGSTRTKRRDLLLDATAAIVIDEGWSAVTMGRLASAVQVSRQSVYNELGSKDKLAVALVARETRRFLDTVQLQLLSHPEDMTTATMAAVDSALRMGEENPLLRAIISAAHGKADGLLPLLTIRSAPVLDSSVMMLTTFADEHWSGLAGSTDELHELVDAIVRLTLSHLVRPQWPVPRVTALVGRLVDAALLAARTEAGVSRAPTNGRLTEAHR
ncbi:TetR family transcriptional regulator [Rhodococcus sp. X156]|uniref:TetR family transcriptional regulator n=1 Tax=Rhodococcus sp. X156 TaxID=2499145 RepID=UPI000FD87891|nr:TetR family transcriptional regulator [Rhodococcus sp. X156]